MNLCTLAAHGHERCAHFPTQKRPFPVGEVPSGISQTVTEAAPDAYPEHSLRFA